MDIDGKALQVEILDTAGQDEYTPLRETFMHTGDGFMLVYSITDDQVGSPYPPAHPHLTPPLPTPHAADLGGDTCDT